MSDKTKNVPKIRFPGFTDEWEQRRLGDESIIVAGGDIDKRKISDMGKYPVLANALTNDGVVGYYKNEYRVEAPAVTVTGRGDVGYAQARKINFTPVVRLLAIKSKHDVDFLENAINNHKVLVESTGVPQLTSPQLGNYKIFFPSLDEERKIGEFFSGIDNLITLHQRKLDHLQEQKKSLLQKMFPKNGETVPEIRFPGFTDAWEQRRLGDVFEQTSEYINPKKENIELWSLTVKDGLIPKSDRYNREFLVRKEDDFKSVPSDEFIYNPMNMTLGAVDLNLTGKKIAVSGYYITMKTTDDYDNKYFKIWLKTSIAIKQYKIFATGSLIERQRVQFPTLSKIKALVPSKEEQIQIGNFISQFDHLITLHQRKLDHLQEQKKSLLQQMFV